MTWGENPLKKRLGLEGSANFPLGIYQKLPAETMEVFFSLKPKDRGLKCKPTKLEKLVAFDADLIGTRANSVEFLCFL